MRFACDVYLPVEFEGRTDVGDGMIVGSTYTLVEALEELREELDIENDDHDEDDELDYELMEEQLEYAWNAFSKAASASLEQQLPLHVIS